MPKVVRGGPRTAVGMAFYDIHELGTASFCPDSNDASTPATEVHVSIQIRPQIIGERPLPHMVAAFKGTATLDAFIEALIEHRTYVFGRRSWDATKYKEQH